MAVFDMDKRVGILHLSDIHTSKDTQATIEKLVEHLINDINQIQQAENIDIRIVCISGDLINSGDNAAEELDIALESFLQPIMDALQINEKNIFIVAGNHEVKQSQIKPYIEAGLESTLISEDKIEKFIEEIDTESIKRIEYFDNDFSTMFGGDLIWKNALTRAYMFSIGELKIGISCVNSSWRSTGIGSAEKRKMVVGRKQIIDSYERIQTADIKICIMHHPFDWLVDEDKTAVEKCINRFDIVLNGHIHEADTKIYTSFNGQTLFNTCGKFDNTSDIYNGYAILAINPYNKNCDVFLRQHIDYPRNCFDKALGVAKDGIFSTSLCAKNDKLALAYNVVHSIESRFLDYANRYFVSNVVAGEILKSFDESFIYPVLSRYSEYEKETMLEVEADSEGDAADDNVTLEDMCNNKHNILLLGKKEIGKTTILHYIAKYYLSNFNVLRTVPIIINALYVDYAGKNVIIRAAHKYVNEYCDSSKSFSINDIHSLLSAGLCAVMFDNFETVGEKELKIINLFLKEFPYNRFIFSEKEDVSSRYLRDVEVVPDCDYETVHICSLTKNQIRAIAVKNFSQEDSYTLVDKIMLCFKKTTLPKTPFVLSLILSLCNTAEFSPINEAVVMEQFMEFLLEKSSPSEVYSTTYDFRIKEDFLIRLVTFMDEQNKFYLSSEEFDSILLSYHADKGFSISETGFDSLFFKKGVLIRTELIVTFRYTCMIEYYLAKKAEQSPEFLKHILHERNFLNYSNEILYYTGLNRQSIEIIETLRAKLYGDFDKFKGILSELENYNIGIDITIPEESFSQKISESKLSQEQSDKIQDSKDISESKLPEEINKQTNHKELDAFVDTLLIYGNCLKNLELISKKDKERAYHDYIWGLCIMLGVFKRNTEDFYNAEVSDMEKFPEKYSEEDIRKIEVLAQDVLKISLPIILQNIALENIGTSKLKSIIEGVIKDDNSSDFAQFFSVFLFCDLRLPGLQQILKNYCSSADNKSLLKIIFFKLLYYYRFRYFSSSLDPFLENLLADINLKLKGGNKYFKSNFIQNIKDQKRLA